jgi:hypothetical protein
MQAFLLPAPVQPRRHGPGTAVLFARDPLGGAAEHKHGCERWHGKLRAAHEYHAETRHIESLSISRLVSLISATYAKSFCA